MSESAAWAAWAQVLISLSSMAAMALFVMRLRAKAREAGRKKGSQLGDLFLGRKERVERDHLVIANASYRHTRVEVKRRLFWRRSLPDKWRR